MQEKIDMKALLNRIEFDGDKKQLVCVNEDGVSTRVDYGKMTLNDAYKAVFGKQPEIKNTKDGKTF